MTRTRLFGLALALIVALPALAFQPPEQRPLNAFEFRHDSLWWNSVYQSLDELPADWALPRSDELFELNVRQEHAFLDARTGRWGTLILTRPMIPGTGIGNDLQWSDFNLPAPRDHQQLMNAAGAAFLRFLRAHEAQLGFAAEEMVPPRMQVNGNERIQLYIGRRIDGIPVEDSYITANINSGNLILMGQRNWGDITLETRPSVNAVAARDALDAHLEGIRATTFRQPPQLRIIPVSDQPDHLQIRAVGQGLDYRLVWVLAPVFRGDIGVWEALVDAHSGELLAFYDTNHYQEATDLGTTLAGQSTTNPAPPMPVQSRGLVGSIFPVSNDGQAPDGVLLPEFPLPFAQVRLDGDVIGFTSTGGNAPTSSGGSLSTQLRGQYVNMVSSCGSINESSTDGTLDLGGASASNCNVPPGGSAGNTNSTRTVFYGIGRINEQARGYLPNNNWLTSPITGRTNVAQTCNATWNSGTNTATFYNSGNGCGNTGEIMAVVHHEWGHGMDANSVNPGISRPGEGIADIYAQNMLNDSCVGRGFFQNGLCTGFGDPCLECSGVRESDWALQQSGQPHDIDWILQACPSGNFTPCGRSTHCEGSIVAETLWDLVHRDLRGFEGSAHNLDLNTALELGTRLTFEGAGAVGSWYQCNAATGGCNADSGYLQYLAANDTSGSLQDGTPHMSAIFAAFNRHQLACSSLTVQDSGCDSGPTQAPANLAVNNLNEGAQLSWDPVPGATEYWIYRTEGPMGCDFGKARVGQVSGTSFTELGLRNGFDVYYSVLAVGPGGQCTGPMTGCVTATPQEGPTGTVAGTVTRAGSGESLAGVQIQAAGPITLSTVTDSEGDFSLSLPEGEYGLTASLEGFASAFVGNVLVEEDVTLTLDFELDAPLLDLPLTAIELVASQGGSGAQALPLGNLGTLALDWTLESDQTVVSLGGDRGFEGPFDLDNWTLVNAPSNVGGSFNVTAGPPIELFVVGGDDTVAGDTDFRIQIPVDGTLSFDWGYQSDDEGQFDRGGYVLNDDFTVLAFNNSQVPYFEGSREIAVSEGDVFAFRVNTTDGRFGEGILGVTNFSFTADICQTPETVEWLSIVPDSGSIAPGEIDQAMIVADASGLATGDYEALLCLATNDPTAGLSVIPVSLSVVEPMAGVLDVSPAALDFGSLTLGDSASDSITVANVAPAGALALDLSQLNLSGDAAFSISGGDCALDSPLMAGSSCTVEITFEPVTPDVANGQFEIAADDGQSAQVSLVGEGLQPPAVLAVSVDALDFGALTLGDSASDSITVANVAPAGALALDLSQLNLSGDAAFTISGGDCALDSPLMAGSSCTVEITFEPVTPDAANGQFEIAADDGQSAQVSLVGEGLQPPAVLSASVDALDLGVIVVGNTASASLVVTNAAGPQGDSLTLSTLALEQTSTAVTLGDGGCELGQTLAAGEQCTVELNFGSDEPGSYDNRLLVASDDGQALEVDLTAEARTVEVFRDRFEGDEN
ncbi:MAG: choice-of-anchor D domain-containing protein [Wenzhouxiangella sp.]